METERETLFISHANPADNQFTAWLASRLSIMGYKVWADLEDLKGGNRHWQVIEDTIRNQATKVLVVTTRASRQAEGVEQEINIAKGVEKELGLDSFIIQLMVDDLPYAYLPPALNNRLAISFTENWGMGLKQLVSQLSEEKIPTPNKDNVAFEFSESVLEEKADSLVEQKEPVFASWLPVALPQSIYLYEFTGAAKTITTELQGNGIPSNFYGDFVLSFALPDSVAYLVGLDTNRLRTKHYKTSEWVEEYEIDNCPLLRKDRRTTLSGLMNIAWESKLEQELLVPYYLSNEKSFFFTSDDKSIVKQSYVDPLGRKTRPITLVGESSRYSSLWHAALSVRFSLLPFPHYSCRLHVAFTDDGKTPITDDDKAFKLRRTFCKQWWNDRWRRIYFAYITRVFDGQESLILSSGGDQSIFVEKPLVFESPYSIKSDVAQNTIEEVEEVLPSLDVQDGTYFDEDMDDGDE